MTSRSSRLLVTVAIAVSAVTASVLAATAAGTVTPPPRTAFVANGYNPADALAAGPIAGRFGAPLFTTQQATLDQAAEDGLVAYAPDLVVVLGGPAALSDTVVTGISIALDLPVRDVTTTPSSGVVRVYGETRIETAVAVGELLSTYGPAWLPVGGVAERAAVATRAESADDAAALGGDPPSAFARAPEAVARDMVCGIHDFTAIQPPFETLSYGAWGVNVYSSDAAETMACTIAVPAGATIVGVTAHVYDADGYDLSGCSADRQRFGPAGETVAEIAAASGQATTAGAYDLDLSPDSPLLLDAPTVVTVDCTFATMTGGPRAIGIRGARVSVIVPEVPAS